MRKLLEQRFAGLPLDRKQAAGVMSDILNGTVPEAQTAALLSSYRMRLPNADELTGFRESVLERATPLDLDSADAIDMVGTGGDGKDTLNITTLSALTVAACGVRVVKHGNGSASSKHGSSDTLRAVGFSFRQNTSDLKRQLDAANITFLHAPLFHPSLGSVAALRRQLGVGTLFNLLGPLVNPARPTKNFIGVADAAVQGVYDQLFRASGDAHCIVHSNDGYDEATLTGPVRCYTSRGRYTLQAMDFGLAPTTAEQIGSAKNAPDQFLRILRGEGSQAETETVAANAGLALQLADGHQQDLPHYTATAKSSLLAGRVASNFEKLLTA